jgi:hypothetical protein
MRKPGAIKLSIIIMMLTAALIAPSAPAVAYVAKADASDIHTAHWGPDGIPNAWCNNHPVRCAGMQSAAIGMAIGYSTYTDDTVTNATLPNGFENALRAYLDGGTAKQFARTVNKLMSEMPFIQRKKACDYCDLVGPADCVVHGYECYGPGTNGVYQELSDWQRQTIVCGGGAVIAFFATRSPIAIGVATSSCFWGAIQWVNR